MSILGKYWKFSFQSARELNCQYVDFDKIANDLMDVSPNGTRFELRQIQKSGDQTART